MIEVEKYAPPETAMPDHSASAQVANIRTQNAITPMVQVNETFYPGELSYLEDNSTGRIGFCATDSYGRKLLITHGHGYQENGSTATVGGHDLDAYLLGYDEYYIKLMQANEPSLRFRLPSDSSSRRTPLPWLMVGNCQPP
jgi:hypothetical protein